MAPYLSAMVCGLRDQTSNATSGASKPIMRNSPAYNRGLTDPQALSGKADALCVNQHRQRIQQIDVERLDDPPLNAIALH